MEKDKMGEIRKDLNYVNFFMLVLKFSFSQAQGNHSFLTPHPLRFTHRTKIGWQRVQRSLKDKASGIQLTAQDHYLTGFLCH